MHLDYIIKYKVNNIYKYVIYLSIFSNKNFI